MLIVLHLLGREVLSLQLDLPAVPVISDLSSVFVPEAVEAEEPDEDEEYEEEEALSRRVRGQKTGF